jgi:hypothetical protein
MDGQGSVQDKRTVQWYERMWQVGGCCKYMQNNVKTKRLQGLGRLNGGKRRPLIGLTKTKDKGPSETRAGG